MSKATPESPEDAQAEATVVYELRVHQVELELQNEELRQARDALHASRDRYRELYDYAPVGYVALDAGTMVREANLTAAQLLGVERFALLSRPFASLLEREAADQLHVHIQKTLGSTSHHTCEIPLRRADGSRVDLRFDSVSTGASSGQLGLCRSTLSDVTARRRADRRLRDLATHLEQLVDRRTAELVAANEALEREIEEHQRSAAALVETRKMEALGRLAGGVAHDFNNLLTVVQLDVAMLRAQAPKEPALQQHVQSIGDAVGRAASLTNQLLAFGRRDVGSTERINVSGAIRAAAPLLSRLVGDHLHVVVEVDEDVGWVTLDRGHFDQILLNLAANARDSMAGGGTLSISAYTSKEPIAGPEPQAWVTIAVRDDGCGMSGETQEHLFEPFFTTRQRDGGTGLGLATVYGIVSRAGGTIIVNSALGRGSEFVVSLPRVEAPVAVEPPAVQTVALGRGETLLLVEDRADVRGVARSVLESGGYEVVEASSGEEALALVDASGGDIAVVLTDIVMPGISGTELRDRLHETDPAMPVVLMSGYPADGAQQSSRYVQKPFAIDELLGTLRDAIDEAR